MTAPEPVSPAPDTDDALRQQVAESIARDKERITSWDELSEWGQELYSQKAHELLASSYVAGLRADLDQARRERDEARRQARAWKLIAAARGESRDAYVKDLNLAIEGLEAYQRELASARPIPDDAVALVSQWLLENVSDINGDRLPDYHTSRPLAHALLEFVRTNAATPATGPAPAAADVQWGVQRADGVLDQMDDEADARGHLNWFDPGAAHMVSRTVVYGPWTPAPAMPQAPAEPTASAKLFNRLIAGASVVNGVPQTPAAREDTATPDGMADFDAQLRWVDGPDDDCNDDLGSWARRTPIQPEEA